MSNPQTRTPSTATWKTLVPEAVVQGFPTPGGLDQYRTPRIGPKQTDPYGRDPKQGLKMLSGKMVWPMDFREDDFDLNDVILGMSRQFRFLGQTTDPVPVLWHTLCLSHMVEEPLQLPALTHDMTEAYMVDLPRPIKVHPEFAFFKKAEDRLFRGMAKALKLPFTDLPEGLHKFDIDIGWAEMSLYNPVGYKKVRSIGLPESQHRDAKTMATRLKRMMASGKLPGPAQFGKTRTAWLNRLRELHPGYV